MQGELDVFGLHHIEQLGLGMKLFGAVKEGARIGWHAGADVVAGELTSEHIVVDAVTTVDGASTPDEHIARGVDVSSEVVVAGLGAADLDVLIFHPHITGDGG